MDDNRARLLWATGDSPVPPRSHENRPRNRLEADPERVERGLVQLVLTLVELIRQLMERQALRRLEGGSLTPEQEEQLGTALMKLAEKMVELREHFELTEDDLNLHLGPLGDLL